jgi:hypothetical protein
MDESTARDESTLSGTPHSQRTAWPEEHKNRLLELIADGELHLGDGDLELRTRGGTTAISPGSSVLSAPAATRAKRIHTAIDGIADTCAWTRKCGTHPQRACYDDWVNIPESGIFHRRGGSSPPSDTFSNFFCE